MVIPTDLSTLLDQAKQRFGSEIVANIDLSNPETQQSLAQMQGFEDTGREAGKTIVETAEVLEKDGTEALRENLDKTNLTEEDKEKAEYIYASTILKAVGNAASTISNSLKKGEGIVFNSVLCDKSLEILESVLEFKEKVDKAIPGGSDLIIKAGLAIITKAITAAYPPIGVAIEASGISGKIAELVSTDNLKKYVEKMDTKLKEIEKDKRLKSAAEKAEKNTELAKLSGCKANEIADLNISIEELPKIIEQVSKKEQTAELFKALAAYSNEVISNDDKVISKKIDELETSITKKLGISLDTKDEKELAALEKVREACDKAETLLMDAKNNQNAKFFDRFESQLNASKELLDAVDKSINIALNQKFDPATKAAIFKNISQKIEKDITGPVERVEAALKNSNIKKVATKLGAGIKTNVVIDRTKTAHLSRSERKTQQGIGK